MGQHGFWLLEHGILTLFYLYSGFVSSGSIWGFPVAAKTAMMAACPWGKIEGFYVRFRMMSCLCFFMAALFFAAPAAALENKNINLLSTFHEGIYWQENTASFYEPAPHETTCSGQGPVTWDDTGTQSTRAVPPDASGPFGPAQIRASLRKIYVAIVIDDVGVDQKRSARAIALPANVTLAFLPYAKNVQAQTKAAQARGHELMVHLPMEPSRMSANPGPDYLGLEHSSEELEERIARNLDAFDGYKGVNNHMGSAFTKHAAGLDVLMRELKKRGVYFLDSKTIPDSIAEDKARAKGIPATHRDVFIDHYETAEQVRAALEKTERVARSNGFAVAIGHPKDVTMEGLEAWLPTLADKGIELIPMSEMIEKRSAARKAYNISLNE